MQPYRQARTQFELMTRLASDANPSTNRMHQQIMKGKSISSIAALGAAGLSIAAFSAASAHYEEPHWFTVSKEDQFEIRKYPRLVAASVTVSGVAERAADSAFSILAGYIFGKNSTRKKIAMTTPVIQEAGSTKIAMTVPVTTRRDQNSLTMKFYMPSQYELDTLPEANDKRIEFEVLAPQLYATVRFSGRAKEESMSKHTQELKKYLEANGLVATGEPLRAYYNPPWTLPFLRRNEVWIPISEPVDKRSVDSEDRFRS